VLTVPSSFLEIVQLANGEVVLQHADQEGEPLVAIRFSEEAMTYVGESGIDIAKVMIQAGIEAAAHLSDEARKQYEGGLAAQEELLANAGEKVLH
jgi:hypothetical protein